MENHIALFMLEAIVSHLIRKQQESLNWAQMFHNRVTSKLVEREVAQ